MAIAKLQRYHSSLVSSAASFIILNYLKHNYCYCRKRPVDGCGTLDLFPAVSRLAFPHEDYDFKDPFWKKKIARKI
jgi:hypothetical protein